MSYYHAKKTAEAKRYLNERDREQAIKLVDDRLQRSRAWLEKYRAREHPTRFDWRPQWPLNTGAIDAEETNEGRDVMAHADAPSEGRGQGGEAEGGGGAAQAGGGDPPSQASEEGFETPF